VNVTSTTKHTKELLDQVRRLLDNESRAVVEPVLRSILEIAKPKTITQVEFRADPADKAEIEKLHAVVVSKEEELRKLRFKLTSAREALRTATASAADELRKLRVTLTSEHKTEIQRLRARHEEELRTLRVKLASVQFEQSGWRSFTSVDEILKVVDKKAKNFMQCIIKCMYVEGHPPDARQKKAILLRSVMLANVVLASYLKRLEACDAIEPKRLQEIINECSEEALQNVARAIYAEARIDVDLKLTLGGSENQRKKGQSLRNGNEL
jgi:hypothetical protein